MIGVKTFFALLSFAILVLAAGVYLELARKEP